ncbi:cyclophilin-like fold protein [Pseudomonas hunanensis]|uniref:cyclophilin-like fold protein n=1 Tax=Pseudomonas hunanensis TaxID=1247546 RepID=UPI0038053FCF
MKINLLINGQSVPATLDDNAASRDFLALLPLTLKLSDYASTEKVADLPKKLSTHGTPAGYAAEAGDITYYAPWGNLAIFYRRFQHASGLVRLGRLEAGLDLLQGQGSLTVTIEANG